MDETAADSVPFPPASASIRAGRQRSLRALLIAIGLLLIVVVAAAFTWIRTSPDFAAIVPADAPVASEIDTSWCWQATASVRRLPKVQTSLANFERQEHVSIQNDIVPWAGNLGVVWLGNSATHNPQFGLCVQVRNWFAFARFLNRVNNGQKLPRPSSSGTQTYDGIAITRSTISGIPGHPNEPAEACMVRNWYVCGFGQGALERILDAYTGKSNSLESTANWAKANTHLQKTPVSWVSVQAAPLIATFARKYRTGSTLDCLNLVAFSDLGNGLRWDVVSISGNDATRRADQLAARSIIPITQASLKYIPNNAVFTADGSDAYYFLHLATKEIASFLSAKTTKSSLETQARLANGLTGPASISIDVQSPSDYGFTAYADAASLHTAKSADFLFTKKWGAIPVRPSSAGTGTPTASSAEKAHVVIATRGNRLMVASSCYWLQPSASGSPYYVFPAEASGSSWMIFGNFRFLPELQKWCGNGSNIPGVDGWYSSSYYSAAELDNAQYTLWLRTDPSGETCQGSALITNWPWRQALNRIVNCALAQKHPTGRQT